MRSYHAFEHIMAEPLYFAFPMRTLGSPDKTGWAPWIQISVEMNLPEQPGETITARLVVLLETDKTTSVRRFELILLHQS